MSMLKHLRSFAFWIVVLAGAAVLPLACSSSSSSSSSDGGTVGDGAADTAAHPDGGSEPVADAMTPG